MMLGGGTTEAGGTDQIKSCFVFTVSETVVNQPDRDVVDPAAGLQLCTTIADTLRRQEFHVDGSTLGKPDGTWVFEVKFRQFNVIAIIFEEDGSGFLEYRMRTRGIKPFWRRPSPQSIFEGWIRTSAAIEKILREVIKVRSLTWLTECLFVALTVSSAAAAQKSTSIDSRVSDILARLESKDLVTRETAFGDIMGMVTEEQPQAQASSRAGVLSGFSTRHLESSREIHSDRGN
jgi:hypothetical protein